MGTMSGYIGYRALGDFVNRFYFFWNETALPTGGGAEVLFPQAWGLGGVTPIAFQGLI